VQKNILEGFCVNVVLAVSEKSVEKYIASFPDINVLKIVTNSKTLYKDVTEMNPHLLLVSNMLAGKEQIENILQRLREEQPQTRIAYLYGADDIIRPVFTTAIPEKIATISYLILMLKT
jgi:DNA-binding NarL/FixJ family response regulator